MTKSKTKTVYKLKWKNLFKLIVFSIIGICTLNATILVFNFRQDYESTQELINTIDEKIRLINIVDDENTLVIEPSEELSKFNSYWNYIKMSMLEVDLAPLKKMNSDTVGWIQIKGTSIDYPVVKKNNTFYKEHSFNKSENSNGWIYLDEKNSIEKIDSITVIRGNDNMFDVLFGELDAVFKNKWTSNEDNHVIKFSTNDYTSLFQVFSIYKSEEDATMSFEDESQYLNYLNDIKSMSEYDFSTSANADDKIISIVSESRDENTYIHAKLIKIKKF